MIMDHSQLRATLLRYAVALVVSATLACHEASTSAGPGGGGGGRTPAPPAGHLVIVVEENSDYSDVIGNTTMPYLNGLAQQYALATQYYADTHPSIGNYFELATGKTWKSYAEDLPSVGYTGGDVGNYARKHNVFALLSDVVNDPAQQSRLVPFTQFATDLANGTLPDFSNVVPNLCNDAHDCSLATADAWLRANLAPLLQSATFQKDGLLVIVFDEAGSDDTHGGGRVACVLVGPKVKRGYQSSTVYQHESLLRLAAEALGLKTLPGAAASAPEMGEFFTP